MTDVVRLADVIVLKAAVPATSGGAVQEAQRIRVQFVGLKPAV